MFKQVRPVEEAEAVFVGREVARHPIEDHGDARPVQFVDQEHQILRCTVATGRREIAGRLVAPRPVKRMLGDRHQLDVGEPEIYDVGDQLRCQVAVVQRMVFLVADPRTDVKFVNTDRRFLGAFRATIRHPRAVVPMVIEIPNH